jgi:speckle-type POZ protein
LTIMWNLTVIKESHTEDKMTRCLLEAPQPNLQDHLIQAVMATDGFKHLVESCPLVMKDLLDMVSRGS